MSFRSRLVSVLLVLALAGVFVWTTFRDSTIGGKNESARTSLFSDARRTLNLWYCDDTLTDYLNEVAVAWNDSGNTYRVEPRLVDGVEFLESVNKASVAADKNMPDIYILQDSSLGRAYEAGLASEITDGKDFADDVVYPAAARNAVTYQGKTVAYPFYFETAALLYNEDYLQGTDASAGDAAAEESSDESASAEENSGGETTPAEESSGEESASAEESGGAASEAESAAVPKTIQDILRFADQYNAPENVTSIFNWDVNDLFYNYYFIGNTMSVGGDCGDDESKIDIYNAPTIQALQVYQKLGQFFSIDTATSSYDQVLSDFAGGKSVFTVATTDAVQKLADWSADGTFQWHYGVAALPDITDDFATRGLSVTSCLVVNGYSENKDAANSFVQFLLNDHNEDFSGRTGYRLARNGCKTEDSHWDGFYQAYTQSVPEPKMVATENFWMLAENAMQQVWDGAEPNATLKSLYEQVEVQVTGNTSFQTDAIADPEEVDVIPETSD